MKNKFICMLALIMLTGCQTDGSGTPPASSDNQWYPRLVGAAGDGAENQLRINGYREVDSFASGNNGYGKVWYSDSSGLCLQVITVNGRVESALDIKTHPRCTPQNASVRPPNDGLSGTEAQFNSMTSPCINQASRLTGVPARDINITNRIRTGGGPLLTLEAAGTKYSCRLEDNGTVTVFSEFAN